VTIARKLDKLGMRSSDTAQIFFDAVRVPQRFRIGEEGSGFVYQMEQFQEERMWAAASVLRPMDRAVQQCIEYTAGRMAFGRRIVDNQHVQFRLAELQTKIELLRALIYRAVAGYVQGEDVTTLASMAKLTCGRLVREVADSCLQYYGGMGFMNETPISRLYRDARVASIGGGADEVMLEIIAKRMGMAKKRAGA
jgi:citronellyl-CoA dehydrogenase